MDMGSAAALYAGSVLLRKTFEAVAQRSLSSLFSRLHVRFRGQRQLEHLHKELESRLQVLSLPVDMCVHYVLHGNTVLQGALDMALRVINDIVAFQEELEAQAYNESISKVSQADAATRLEGFLTQLDSLLPYMSMAMNAVSLLQGSNKGLSPSRLMEASYLIRSAGRRDGVVMSIPGKLYKYERHLTLPRWQEKLMACNVRLRQSVAGKSDFELSITDDGSDSTGPPESVLLPIAELVAIGSSTLHVLGLGEHELEAVLLLDALGPPSLSSTDKQTEDGHPSNTLLKEFSGKLVHYAIRCVEDDGLTEDRKSPEGALHQNDSDSESSSYLSQNSSSISKLGVLQYALFLCLLQMREDKEHWCLPDERISLFFNDPRNVSEPVVNIQKSATGGSDFGCSTPTPRALNKSQAGSSSSSRPSSCRSNISDLLYELNVDSPVKRA